MGETMATQEELCKQQISDSKSHSVAARQTHDAKRSSLTGKRSHLKRLASSKIGRREGLNDSSLGYAFPRHRLDRDWEVQDVSDVCLLDDGSVQCVVTWEPTVVSISEVVGERLRLRCKEVFIEKYGVEEWERSLTLTNFYRQGCRGGKARTQK